MVMSGSLTGVKFPLLKATRRLCSAVNCDEIIPTALKRERFQGELVSMISASPILYYTNSFFHSNPVTRNYKWLLLLTNVR